MNLVEIQTVQAVDQITDAHIQIMNDLIYNGQRAEVYIYYAKLIGDKDPSAVTQLMEQAQERKFSAAFAHITPFSTSLL